MINVTKNIAYIVITTNITYYIKIVATIILLLYVIMVRNKKIFSLTV